MEISWKLTRRSIFLATLLACVLINSGCKRQDTVNIHISAASSLTQVVTDLIQAYEKEHPHVRIIPNYAGTNTLKMQIIEGADVDIFLSANEKYYRELESLELIAEGAEFARNKLCMIRHKDNDKVMTLEDVSESGLQVIIGHEDVPVGAYTIAVLNNLNEYYGKDYAGKVLANVVSKESNVKRIVTKINLNEGDAGFVYQTDITQSVKENLMMIPIDDKYNVISHYYAGLIKKEEEQEEAKALYDYIFQEKGKEILKNYGFMIE